MKKEKELLQVELKRLETVLDNLDCGSVRYHLVSQAINEIEKELENGS